MTVTPSGRSWWRSHRRPEGCTYLRKHGVERPPTRDGGANAGGPAVDEAASELVSDIVVVSLFRSDGGIAAWQGNELQRDGATQYHEGND
jgi:hypothetical protein